MAQDQTPILAPAGKIPFIFYANIRTIPKYQQIQERHSLGIYFLQDLALTSTLDSVQKFDCMDKSTQTKLL